MAENALSVDDKTVDSGSSETHAKCDAVRPGFIESLLSCTLTVEQAKRAMKSQTHVHDAVPQEAVDQQYAADVMSSKDPSLPTAAKKQSEINKATSKSQTKEQCLSNSVEIADDEK